MLLSVFLQNPRRVPPLGPIRGDLRCEVPELEGVRSGILQIANGKGDDQIIGAGRPASGLWLPDRVRHGEARNGTATASREAS